MNWKKYGLFLLLAGLIAFTSTSCSDDEPPPLPDYSTVIQGEYTVLSSYLFRAPFDTTQQGILTDTIQVVIDRVNENEVRFTQSDGLTFRAQFVRQLSNAAVFQIINDNNYEGVPIFEDTSIPDWDLQHGIFSYPAADGDTSREQSIVYKIAVTTGDIANPRLEYECNSIGYQE